MWPFRTFLSQICRGFDPKQEKLFEKPKWSNKITLRDCKNYKRERKLPSLLIKLLKIRIIAYLYCTEWRESHSETYFWTFWPLKIRIIVASKNRPKSQFFAAKIYFHKSRRNFAQFANHMNSEIVEMQFGRLEFCSNGENLRHCYGSYGQKEKFDVSAKVERKWRWTSKLC